MKSRNYFGQMLQSLTRNGIAHGGDITVIRLDLGNAVIPGLVKTGWVVEEPQIGMAQSGLEEIHGSIVRKGIHDDHFLHLIQPLAHRFQMIRHKGCGIPGGDYDTDRKHLRTGCRGELWRAIPNTARGNRRCRIKLQVMTVLKSLAAGYRKAGGLRAA
jgi:hypothetical protein